MFSPQHLDRVLPWLLRVCWVGVLVAGGSVIETATADNSDGVKITAELGGLALWICGVAAMAILATISLTATRIVVPISIPIAIIALTAGADSVDVVVMLCLAFLSSAIAFSAETGRAFIQASAYGEEDRFPLRPPASYALAAGIAWLVLVAAAVGGPLYLASEQWFVGIPVTIAAIGSAVWLWPRWHRLSTRWFVVVPIGIVIHDQLVLAETLMLRRQEIAAIHLASADTEAADLTGPAAGHTIEIVTAKSVTAVFASTPREPRGKAIHLTACLVAPTRPGRALQSAAERRLPVG